MTNLQKQIHYWSLMLDESFNKFQENEDSEKQVVDESKMSKIELDNFNDKLKNGIVEFDFIKKDGTKRHARGTLCPDYMPSKEGIVRIYSNLTNLDGTPVDVDDLLSKLEARKAYMPYFWDLENSGYRQFHVSRFIGLSDGTSLAESDEEYQTPMTLGEILTSLQDVPAHYMHSQPHIGPYGRHYGDIEFIEDGFDVIKLMVKKGHSNGSAGSGPVAGCITVEQMLDQLHSFEEKYGSDIDVVAVEQLDPLSKQLGKNASTDAIIGVEIAPKDGVWLRI